MEQTKVNLQVGMEAKELSIPEEWSLEDFKGCKPYEWLYGFRDNPLLYSQKYLDLKTQAKKLGFSFSNFEYMLDAYRRSKTVQLVGDYDTNFIKQPIQLKSGKYICDEYGVAYIDRFGAEVEVCSHAIMPVARILNQDTGEQHIRIAFQRGNGSWKEITVTKEEAFSANKVMRLANQGVAVTSDSAKELATFLCQMESLNYDSLPEIHMTSKLGWHGNTFVPYDNTLRYLDNGNAQIVEAVRTHGGFEAWKDTVREIRDGQPKHLPVRMALASSFASPLLSRIGYLPFWCNLSSTISSSGKSVSLMVAASVWGDPCIGKGLPQSANSTTNALEVQASTLNHIPLFLDELQTAQREKGFAQTAYNLCEGAGKVRLNRSVKVQSLLHWHLTTISSGEQSVTNELDHEGALARVIEVKVKEPVFDDPHKVAEAVKVNYGYAGKKFVESLTNEDFEALKHEADRISQALQNKGIQLKQADSGAILILSDRLASRYIFEDEAQALTENDVLTFLKLESDTDMNRRVYEHVCGWCMQYKGNFESDGNKYTLQYFGKQVNETHFRILKNPLQAELIRNGFDFNAFIEWCVNHGAVKDKYGTPAKQHGSAKNERLIDFYTDIFDTEPG